MITWWCYKQKRIEPRTVVTYDVQLRATPDEDSISTYMSILLIYFCDHNFYKGLHSALSIRSNPSYHWCIHTRTDVTTNIQKATNFQLVASSDKCELVLIRVPLFDQLDSIFPLVKLYFIFYMKN